jgi:hypothetical protein
MNFKLKLTSYLKWSRRSYDNFMLWVIFVITENDNMAFMRLINTLYTFAGRWTQFNDQEGAAAESCGPANGAQDGSMWATREPTAGAWRACSTYLSTGPLREQDFSFSFLHTLQKTRIMCCHIGTVTITLFCEIIYCCNWRYVNNLKIHSFWHQLWLLWLYTYYYYICFYFFIYLLFRYVVTYLYFDMELMQSLM